VRSGGFQQRAKLRSETYWEKSKEEYERKTEKALREAQAIENKQQPQRRL